MKSSVVLIIAVISTFCTYQVSAETSDFDDWVAFKRQYNKNYTRDEEQRRFDIFVANKRHVERHNTKASSLSFTQALNSLSDLTTEEINRSRNGFRLDLFPFKDISEDSENNNNTNKPATSTLNPLAFLSSLSRATPASLDWRQHGRVSPVRDQGSCGSCWAFATTGALESQIVARNKSLIHLSEQNLIDCSRAYGNHGCDGGLPTHALRYIHWNGIESARTYPYAAKDNECKFKQSRSMLRTRNPIVLPHNDENYLRRALAAVGPLPVAIDASAKTFHLYKSGVYDDLNACSNPINHALLLIGYGRQQNLDYWLLKNSWSREWGDDGYMKILRNKNACGIASFAVLPLVI